MKRLDKQQTELEMCEKALADYMESKRRAFPRFYFVSSADLLDILSNGNNPVKVMQHMSKCFQVSWAIVGQSSSSSFIGEWAAWLALEAVAHTAWAQCSSSRQFWLAAWPGLASPLMAEAAQAWCSSSFCILACNWPEGCGRSSTSFFCSVFCN